MQLPTAVLQLALYGGADRPTCPLLLPLCPFLSCPLSYFNFRHTTLHFGENFMKIGSKSKKLSMFKGQFYMYSSFEIFVVEWDFFSLHVLILSTSHDTYLLSNPNWSTVLCVRHLLKSRFLLGTLHRRR